MTRNVVTYRDRSTHRRLPKLDTHGNRIEAGRVYWWDAWEAPVVPYRVGRKLMINVPRGVPVEVSARLAGTLAPMEHKSESHP